MKYVYIVLMIVIFGRESAAQVPKGETFLMLQATASMSDETFDTSRSSGHWIRQNRNTDIYLAVSPAFRLGEVFCMEVECGVGLRTSEQQYTDISIVDKEFIFTLIPHVMVSPLQIDSTITFYARVGYGLSTSMGTSNLIARTEVSQENEIGTIFSLGGGLLYFMGERVFGRVEIALRNLRSESGVHVVKSSSSTRFSFFCGVGLRL